MERDVFTDIGRKNDMLIVNYTSKKQLRESKGLPLDYTETSLYGAEYKSNGTVFGSNRPWHTGIKDRKGNLCREFFTKIKIENDLIKEVQ